MATYKYAKILMDENKNYPQSTSLIKKITIEEYQDLLHHSHKEIEDLTAKIDAILSALAEQGINVDLDSGVIGYQDEEGNTIISEASDFGYILANSDETEISFALKKDVTTDTFTVKDKKVTLDLGGNTLTSGNGADKRIIVDKGASLTISNGKLVSTDGYDANHKFGVITITNGGSLTVNGLEFNSITDDPVNKGNFGFLTLGKGEVVINDIDATVGWYVVSSNGTYQDPDNNCRFIINGGNLYCPVDFGIYLPSNGYVEVNGGNVIGGAGAIAANSGHIVLNDGVFRTTADGDTGTWSDGTGGDSCALLSMTAKYNDVRLEIHGGTFIVDGDAPLIEVGTKHAVNITIDGGKFNVKPNDEWLAEGYNVTGEPVDGYYKVYKALQ